MTKLFNKARATLSKVSKAINKAITGQAVVLSIQALVLVFSVTCLGLIVTSNDTFQLIKFSVALVFSLIIIHLIDRDV